jgi:hypothetical protein
MKIRTKAGLLLSLVIVVSASHAAPASHAARLDAVTFVVRHRVFHNFHDQQRVKLNQDFPLGDTEFLARVVQFVPDFQMDLEHHKIFSLTDQPNNPAFKIVVRKGKVPQDTTWAFLNNPPHFVAKSYFSFQVMRIDFVGRAPLLHDTTGTAPGRPAGTASAAKDSAR